MEGWKAEPCRDGQRSWGDSLQVSDEKVVVTQGFGLGREDNWIKPDTQFLWLEWGAEDRANSARSWGPGGCESLHRGRVPKQVVDMTSWWGVPRS